MGELVLLLLIAMTVVAFSLLYIANVKAKGVAEKLESTKDLVEEELCTRHDWEELYILLPEELAKVDRLIDEGKLKEYVETKTKSTACIKCGYISGLDRMLKKSYLRGFRASYMESRKKQQQLKDIGVLEKEFLQDFIKSSGLSPEKQELFRAGYELHSNFVIQMPDLLEKKEKS